MTKGKDGGLRHVNSQLPTPKGSPSNNGVEVVRASLFSRLSPRWFERLSLGVARLRFSPEIYVRSSGEVSP
jgi:hypothetical protein